MEQKFIDQVKIEVDDRYTIAVSKDHARGVVVQVARMNPTHVSTDKGVIYKGHQPVVVWQTEIAYAYVDKTKGQLVFKELSKIQEEIAKAIGSAQGIVAQAQTTENFVDGLLAQLESDFKK